MKPTEQTCDLQRIDAYLEERLSDALAGEFERHLCECDRCRRELEKRSAEPEVWREFVALLGPSSSPEIGLGSHRWYEDEGPDFGEQSLEERRNSRLERYVSSVLESLAPTDDPAMLGRVGDYEISGVVGVGGMGAVLKGFDKSLRRVVAIKVMAPHLAHSGSARTRFQREARAAAAITHDNVIDIYAVSEAAGLPYLVMPYARGPSLQKRIDEGGPLGVVEVVRIGRQIAAGLSAAHEQGLVHRDIKPANILLSDGIERLWITDFGVARAMDDASMTQTGVIAGTPQYMSPEQARGESVDHRSDLFSLGSVLYTACTGRPPFRSEAAYGILRRITDSEPRPIREINSEIPEWLCVIIGRLLAKHPADRFESAGEVVDLLDGCLSHLQQPHQVELPASLRSQGMIEDPRRLIAGVSNRSEPQVQPVQPPRQFFSKRGLIMIGSIFLAGLLGVLSMQWTKPTDISGHWTGESWQHISLVSVDEASDWYSGTFLDATGRTGALRLEWSRWQRRYNGRWKVGEAESGQITLRASENGMLRGALSVDPESPLEPEVPRLLEFAWRPASDEAQQGFASRMAESKRKRQEVDRPSPFRTASIQSPTQGIIVRIAKGIQLNRRVEAGDFIAEIELAESTVSSLQEQLAILRRKSEAGKTRVYSLERERGAAREICMAIEEQIKNLEAAKQQNSSAVDNGLETASTPIQVQNHLDTAVVALRKAEADALKLDSERNLALEDIALCDREIVNLEVKIGQVSRLQILAPVAGRVTSVNALVEGNTVKEGDVICVLEQEPVQTLPLGDDVVEAGSSLTPAADTVPNDPTSVARPSSPLQGLSAMRPASELAKRLRESRHRLARIDSAIEEQKAKRSQAEIKLLSLRERRGQAKEDGLANNLLDVGIAQSESIIQAIENEIEHSQAEKRLVGVELAEAEHEHQYILEILQTQLSAAQGQWELEKTSRERMEATRKQGHTSDMELRQAEQAVAMAESDLRQLKLLYEFYSRIGKNNEEPKSEER